MVVATAAASGSPTTAELPPPNDVVAGLTAVPKLLLISAPFCSIHYKKIIINMGAVKIIVPQTCSGWSWITLRIIKTEKTPQKIRLRYRLMVHSHCQTPILIHITQWQFVSSAVSVQCEHLRTILSSPFFICPGIGSQCRAVQTRHNAKPYIQTSYVRGKNTASFMCCYVKKRSV